MGGANQYVSFMDNHLRMIWVYLLKSKYDVFGAFQHFHAIMTTQIGTKLQFLQMYDGVMCTNAFHKFCDDLCIKREFVMSNNSSSKDVA